MRYRSRVKPSYTSRMYLIIEILHRLALEIEINQEVSPPNLDMAQTSRRHIPFPSICVNMVLRETVQ